jgi:diguanylate cyclase (GGDEF)-like protein
LQKLRQVVASRQGIAEEMRIPEVGNGQGGGEAAWFSLQAVPLGDGVAVTLRDITERKSEQERLTIMAQTDALTGLANRRAFAKRLRHAIESSRRLRHQRLLAVLFLDIDHFKLINDTLGHTVGDRILQVFASRLLACVRAADTVARPGGDEFTILLENLDTPGDAERVVEAIFASLREPVTFEGHVVPVAASIGVAYFSGGEVGADELLRRADAALYAAKRGGRNQFRVFGGEL